MAEVLRLRNLFHRHKWEYVSEEESSWAESYGSFVCYRANYQCLCGVKGHLDAGSRMMGWTKNIHEVD